MDGQNQKYINCLHVITQIAAAVGYPTPRAGSGRAGTKEAIYKQQSEIGILIDFFLSDCVELGIGSGRSGRGRGTRDREFL